MNMVIPSEGTSPASWINQVVSKALAIECESADEWCVGVASQMASDGVTRAAIVAIDSGELETAAGTSLEAGASGENAWIANLSSEKAIWNDDEFFASAEYGNQLVSGEVRVSFAGVVGLRRSHVPLLASLLAEVYRHRVAEPAARRASILAQLRPSQRPIVPLLTTGMSQRDISKVLGKSPHTVHDHTKMIYRTLNVHSRVELASKWHGFPIEQPSE